MGRRPPAPAASGPATQPLVSALHAAGATQRRLHLQQGLAREDGQRLLEARNLLLAASLTLTVAHRLRLALRLELVQVGQDRVELLARRGLVLLVVAEGNLELLHLVRLAVDIALLRRLRHGVVLGELVVRGLRGLLIRLRLREHLGEVALRDLEHGRDGRADVRVRAAELRLANLHEGGLAVVLREHVDGLRHGGRGILEVRGGLDVLLVLLLAHSRGLGLARVDLRDLGLERLDVLRQLRLVRLGLGDARRRLVELAGEVRLLRLGLTDLLVAERLLVRLLSGLLRELGNHILDEAAHLAERVRARARRELHEREAVELLREAAEHAHRLRARVVALRRQAARARGGLEEDLHALGQDLLRLLDRRGLLARLLLARRPLRRLRLAALLQLRQVLRVRRERRLRLGQGALRRVELLLRRRARLRRLAKLLLRDGDLVLEALLEHRVGVLGLHLVLARAAQGLLRLALHVRDRVEDARALRRVGRGGGLRLQGQVLVLRARLRLQQRLDDGLLVRVHPGRLHDLREPARDRRQHLRGLAGLHEAEVLLQHRGRALERVHRVHELLLRGGEVRVLLVADLRRGREVRLRGGDLLRQLVDRARQAADRRLGVLDGGLEVPDRALRARDGVLLRVRLLVAPRRVLLHQLRLILQVQRDLPLELVQELDHLLDRRHRQHAHEAEKHTHRRGTDKLRELLESACAQTLE